MSKALRCCAALVLLIPFGSRAAHGQSDEQVWSEVAEEVLDEVNLIRQDPAAYAEEVLVPLKLRMVRVPEDEQEKFKGYKFVLSDQDPVDYYWISEDTDPEKSIALIDEAIKKLSEAKPRKELTRNDILDRAAQWYARDYLDGGRDRPPHVDSLGRKPGPRIAAFGAPQRALDGWNRFVARRNEQGEAKLHVFHEKETFYLVEYPSENRCRYRSIPKSLGEFAVEHGEEMTLPVLDKPGVACAVQVDRDTKTLKHGEATTVFPMPMPIHGENSVWGPWSRRWAARGLVCWWILDPGVPDRGHRKTLLDGDFRFAGVGVAWRKKLGWVAVLDVSAEPLVEHRKQRQRRVME